jgi:hypothetical protein
MTTIEAVDRLARDICWLGLTTPGGRAGKTKASYWKSLPEETRERYRQEASNFVWLYDNLDHHLLIPLSLRDILF